MTDMSTYLISKLYNHVLRNRMIITILLNDIKICITFINSLIATNLENMYRILIVEMCCLFKLEKVDYVFMKCVSGILCNIDM